MANKSILSTPRKQKYPFKTMVVGETFKVHQLKYNSMLTAYRQHNKLHDPIELSSEKSTPGFYLIKRIA